MSSASRQDTKIFRAITIAFALVLALALALAVTASRTDATRLKTSAASSKLPKITKVTPLTAVAIGTRLSVSGKNFVKGKKKLIIIFKRDGSKRQFTVRGDATSTTRGTVVVPNVYTDLIKVNPAPQDNIYRLRPITKFGAAKAWTGRSISPKIDPSLAPVGGVNTGASGDCDNDGIANGTDTDDDNDLLSDTIEFSIGTDVCVKDTDSDGPTDYYEYTVAYAYNGGPTLPYPALRPFPNPLVGDAGFDFDGDELSQGQEYSAWQYTGLMSRFYSDANQDSDYDGRFDGAEDEDHDLLPNLTELNDFTLAVDGVKPPSPLLWLRTDTDGDGLCDGLDDQDHDGPPTSLAVADCSTSVPNNGPLGNPVTTTGSGDPDGSKTDGDDNKYSNFYEWYLSGVASAYDPCDPDPYPTSPFCPADDFNPLPVPGP